MKRFWQKQPYVHPIVTSFRGVRFQAAIDDELSDLRREATVAGIRIRRKEHWLHVSGVPGRRPKQEWGFKLYLCVEASDFWRTTRWLLRQTVPWRLRWKLWTQKASFARPDKVVIYFASRRDLAIGVRRLSAGLAGARTHDLAHACLPRELGFRSRVRGMYIGLDPWFLKVSWRMFRAIVVASIRLNRLYYRDNPGELKRVLRGTNVSEHHEGPRSLSPTSRNKAFIKEFWRESV